MEKSTDPPRPSSDTARSGISLATLSPAISRAIAFIVPREISDLPLSLRCIRERSTTEQNTLFSEADERGEESSHETGDIKVPDGGIRAWLVVLGGFLNFTTSFGLMNAFGIFQAFYAQDFLSHKSASAISWIGSVQLFLMFIGGPLVGPAFDRWGARPVMITGTTIFCLSFISTWNSTKYVQILLSQGFLFGTRNAILYYPATSAIAEWFDKRQSLALGIALSGSAIGGIIWPIFLNNSFTQHGFARTNRDLLFISLPVLLLSCLLVKERKNSSGHDNHGHQLRLPRRLRLSREVFQPDFITLCIAMFFIVAGMVIPFNWIADLAASQGYTQSISHNLLSICYAGSTVGRILMSWAGDKFGRFNTLFFITIGVSTLTYSWLLVHALAAHITFVALYGIFTGAIMSLGSSCVAQTTQDMGHIGLRIGIMMAACSPGSLVGIPTSGILLAKFGWHPVYLFSASMTAFGGLVFLGARWLSVRRWLAIV